jgi:uncharacterized membrane protein YesL
MKPSTLANLALFLAIAGWMIYAYATIQLMGEFSPAVPKEYVQAFKASAMRTLYTGIFTLLISLVLSIKVLKITPWRSAISLTILLLPLSFLAVIYFKYG